MSYTYRILENEASKTFEAFRVNAKEEQEFLGEFKTNAKAEEEIQKVAKTDALETDNAILANADPKLVEALKAQLSGTAPQPVKKAKSNKNLKDLINKETDNVRNEESDDDLQQDADTDEK